MTNRVGLKRLPDGTLDWVYVSAQMSAVSQVVLGLISLLGFVATYSTDLLVALLITDFVVQIIEFIFYVSFICIARIETWYRYMDWFVTTPIMLISNIGFVKHLEEPDITVGQFATTYRNDIVFIILMNSIMLAFGLCEELKWVPRQAAFPLAWIAFLSVFYVIFARFAYVTVGGVLITTFVFVVWALYGVAAFLPYRPKNVCYNCLDVVSKNFYGIIVAVYMLVV